MVLNLRTTVTMIIFSLLFTNGIWFNSKVFITPTARVAQHSQNNESLLIIIIFACFRRNCYLNVVKLNSLPKNVDWRQSKTQRLQMCCDSSLCLQWWILLWIQEQNRPRNKCPVWNFSNKKKENLQVKNKIYALLLLHNRIKKWQNRTFRMNSRLTYSYYLN